MKKAFAFASLIACAFSEFSDDLIRKYSIEIMNEGDADTQPNSGDPVSMHYDGTLVDGTKFDSSYDRGQPLDIRIGKGQVIKCWDEVGVNLNINQKVKVVCPSDTAYGNRAIGPIPANSDLVFIIERVKWFEQRNNYNKCSILLTTPTISSPSTACFMGTKMSKENKYTFSSWPI